MSKTKHSGKCCICGQNSNLTFEHIPPQSVHNNKSTQIIDGEEMTRIIAESKKIPLDFKGARYRISQRGVGDYTLSKSCNEKMGGWYAREYNLAIHALHYFIEENKKTDKDYINVYLPNFRPLNFIKQVLSMFCSVSKGTLIEKYPEISDLLLDKNANNINYSKIKISMCLLKSGNQELAGPTALLLSDNRIRILSMIKTYPVCFTLEENPFGYEDYELDITKFFEAEYNEKKSLSGAVPYYDLPSPFPGCHKSGTTFKLQGF